MWTRNNDVSNQNMLKHFIYLSFSKLTTSSLCSLYYRYSSKVSSFFCILSFLVIAIFIDQTFYSATHYLAAVWLDSRHDLNIKLRIRLSHDIDFITHSSHSYRRIESKEICLPDDRRHRKTEQHQRINKINKNIWSLNC